MLVLLNALQAGNLSGTGTYAAQLARWLPGLTNEFDFAVAWPQDTAIPTHGKNLHEAFLRTEANGAASRFWFDQVGR